MSLGSRKIYVDAISGVSASAIFMAISGWLLRMAERNADQETTLLVVAILLFLAGFLGMFFSLTMAMDEYSRLSKGKRFFGYLVSVLLLFSMILMIAVTIVQG